MVTPKTIEIEKTDWLTGIGLFSLIIAAIFVIFYGFYLVFVVGGIFISIGMIIFLFGAYNLRSLIDALDDLKPISISYQIKQKGKTKWILKKI